MAPEWNRTSLLAPEGITIADIDADKSNRIRQEYEIRGFPTLLVVQDGLSLSIIS